MARPDRAIPCRGDRFQRAPAERDGPVEPDHGARYVCYRFPAIQSFSRLLGSAPTWVAAGLPSLNRISVGIPRTANWFGAIGLLSISTFATVNLPANSPASSSSAGPIILQGPHHSA